MKTILFQLTLGSILWFFHGPFLAAQCDFTPVSSQEWQVSPSVQLVTLEAGEMKWFRFPITRERMHFRFQNVSLTTSPVLYDVAQTSEPFPSACPTNWVEDGSIVNDNEDFINGFEVGGTYGFIRFWNQDETATSSLKFAVLFGDETGEGAEDFNGGVGIPQINTCGGNMNEVSTLMRFYDQEVNAYLGPQTQVGVWFRLQVTGDSYVNLDTEFPMPGFGPQLSFISDINTGAGLLPSESDIPFENGAFCTWGNGIAAGDYYLYVHTPANEAPGFINFCLNLDPVPLPDVNDALEDALPIAPSPFGNHTFTHAAIGNATHSPYPQDCTNYSPNTFHNGEDIWYSFTATQSDYYFIIKNIADHEGTLSDVKMSVLTADGSQVVANSCEIFYPIGATEAVSEIRGLIPGNVYNIRLGGWSDENFLCAAINCSFDFCLGQPNCSLNDECSEAIHFTPPAPGGSITISGTTYCAELESTGDCDISMNRSAWYSFMATETSYDITLDSYQDVFSIGYNGIDLELTTDCSGSPVPGSCIDLLVGQTEPISGLAIGQTYYLRVSTNFTDAAFTLRIERPNVLNECANFSTLPVSASCNYTNISTAGATQSLEGDCGGDDNDDDVWYNFTPTTANTMISVANLEAVLGNVNTIHFGIYQTCGTAVLDCFSLGAGDEHIVSSLTPGQTYKLQMYTLGTGNFGTFDVCVQSEDAPANDLCADAQFFSPSSYNSPTPNTLHVNTLGATAGTNDCYNDSADDELWYSFTATGNNYLFKAQNIVVNSGQSGFPVVKIEFFESCGGTSLGCFNLFDGYGKTQLFTVGQTYSYRVWTDGTDYTATFDLIQLQLPDSPANDYCDAPVPLSVHAFNAPCTPVTGSTLGGTYSLDFECGFDWWDDVFFSFTADYASVSATFSNISQLWGSSTGLRVQLFDACLSGYDFVCHEVVEGDRVLFSNLNVGQTYYIKVFSANCVECYTSFDVCLKEGGPPNDTPNFSYEFHVNNGNPIIGTTTNASDDNQYSLPTCVAPGTTIQDVWYFLENYDHINGQFTISNASNDIHSVIYKGDINTPDNLEILPFSCGSGNRTYNLSGLEQGQYYWLRVWSENGQTGTFEVFYEDLTPSTATVAFPAPNTCSPTTSVTVNESNLNTGIPLMLADDAVLILYPNGNDLGQISVDFYVSSTPRTDDQGIPYLKRNLAITPQHQPTPGNPVTLRFLMTAAEFNSLAVSLPELKVTRVNSQSCASAVAGSGNTLLSQPYPWANGNFLDGYFLDVQTDHFSSFYVHGGGVPLQGALLPVELFDFEVREVGENTAKLTWRTTNEQDNEGFFIEKSTDGRLFTPIGFLAGKGTISSESSYSFLDGNFTADAYFRLRQVDFQGEISYSQITFLEKQSKTDFLITTNLEFGEVISKQIGYALDQATVRCFDVQGKLLLESNWPNKQDYLILDVTKWVPGLYFFELSHQGGRLVRKVVIN